MMNPEVKEGDKIILVYMKDEQGMTPGTKGVVTRVTEDPFEKDELLIYVDWENGRSLSIVSSEDLWLLDTEEDKKENIQEAVKLKNQSCSQFTIGSKFCDTLTGLLKTQGSFKSAAIDFFNELLNNIDLTGPGQKVKLEPGNPHFDERYGELVRFYNILKDSGQCKKMLSAIEKDLESVKEKGLVMVVDNDDKYSLFNRLNTHYTNQAVILTKAILDSNKNWKSVGEIDLWKPEMVKSNIIDYLDPTPENLEHIDRIISDILNDERETSMMLGDFDYTKGMGDVVESEIAKAFREKGYEVFEFGGDFGFVDHFGVDMVVMKDGKIHPVQASSMRKSNPKFFQFNEPDCQCWSVFPYGKSYRVETLLEQTKGDLVNKVEDENIDVSVIEDLIGQLTDEDITDLFLRNLDRKFLKGGDKEKNVRDYITKYIQSLSDRTGVDADDDFNVEDEFLYGGIEPEKSKIGRKTFKKELLPLQVELLKLQEDVKKTGKAVAVVFEGRDSAGKGSVIKQMTEYLDPKYYNVIALGIPTPEEKKDWFGRYEKEIEPGKINFFDRSWYNRGIVEPVMGYSSEEEYLDFMENVNGFEQSLVDRGIELVKFWLSITPETQKKRFALRKASPLKYWKFSPNDEASIDKWDDYTEYKNRVMKQTREAKPWTVVDSNDKRAGILNAFRHLLNVVDYEGKDDSNIGSVYPEVVTTIKEKELSESYHWTDWQKVVDVLGKENKYLFDFFEKLRQSGVMNMLESTHFVYSGSDYLRRYIEYNEYDEYDESKYEELYKAADLSKDAMIRIAIDVLEKKGEEPTLNNLNKMMKGLARQAMQSFIMQKTA